MDIGGITWKHGALGLAILVAAAIAGFATRPQPAPAGFGVAWTSHEHPLANRSRTIAGGTAAFNFTVDRANVTHLAATVRVTVPANHTAEDPVRVHVVDPGDNATMANGTVQAGAPANVTATRRVAEAPGVGEVVAPNASAAKAKLAANHTSTAGRGNWTVRVEVVHGPGRADHTIEVAAVLGDYHVELLPS